jgi:geranylgeranyl diphosphate synthase type II
MITRSIERSFTDRLDHYRLRIEQELKATVMAAEDAPERLQSAMAYSVLGGGKRIRPLLAYACGELFELDENQVAAIATAVELVHAYSLVHDDLPSMDDDDLRRGRPTTHRKFDEATAILAGDALQALAFDLLAEDPQLRTQPDAQVNIMARLAKAIGPSGMAGGQALDIEAETGLVNESILENIHRRKTGELIRASIMMPSELAAVTKKDLQSLDAFGRDIGLVFQIRDDLLEEQEDTATLGKNASSDKHNQKSTYPTVLGIKRAEERAAEFYDRAMSNLVTLGPRAAGLRWVSDYIINRSN